MPDPSRQLSLPPQSAEYAGLLRGPRRAWWRPLLSLVLLLVFLAIGLIALMIATVPVSALLGRSPTWLGDELGREVWGPTGIVVGNLMLALGVPATLLATRLAHGIPAGYVHSVTGRFRWGWFAKVTAALIPLWLCFLAVYQVAGGATSIALHPEFLAMLIVVLLTTPLQCAGEEYVFRAWILQNVGGLFASRWAAFIVPTLLSAVLFGLAHGSLDHWILLDLAVFAVATVLITRRTGGIEAAVALHTVNNSLLMISTLVFGGFEQIFIGTESTGSPVSLASTVVLQLLALLIVYRLARGSRLQQTSRPLPGRFTSEDRVPLGEGPR